MAKTPIFSMLQEAFRLAQISSQKGMPPADEVAEWLESLKNRPISRRKFLHYSIQGGIGLGAASILPKFRLQDPTAPRIVIIGAGMAGLHAGHILLKNKINAKVSIYEAAGRVGGRIHTGFVNANTGTTEVGGEFIDSTHADMLGLAREFGVSVFDRESDKLIPEMFFLEGHKYTQVDAIKAFQQIRKKISTDSKSRGLKLRHLDNTPLEEYFAQLEADNWFIKFLSVAYTGECGLDTKEQSALNFIGMIGRQKKGSFDLYGGSDERYKLKGGNQQLCERMASELGEQIHLNHPLIAIRSKGKGFILQFDGEDKEIQADHIIMTVPFTILRDVDGVKNLEGMSPKKWQCIQELGYGKNGKYFLEMRERSWRKQGHQGYLFTEKIHSGWDSYHLQNDNKGEAVYCIYLGGEAGAQIAKGKGTEFLPDMENVYAGSTNDYTGISAQCNWYKHKYAKGSYNCTKVGQWTTISQYIAEPVGNMIFAGEHCSESFGGFMNGAAETGRLAAEKLIKLLKTSNH